MKKIQSILAIAVFAIAFTSCKDTASAPKEDATATTDKTVAANAKMETANFNITGMTCAMGCAKTIEKELTSLDGVQNATVDFDKKAATVSFDSNVQNTEKLVETVEAAADGKTYKVSDVKTTGDHASLIDPPVKKKKVKKGDIKTTTEESKTDAKPGCCAGKKHCSEDEKATM